MPHQCVHCSKIIEPGSKEILTGCNNCKGKFFFYIREEQVHQIKEKQKNVIQEFNALNKKRIENDVRTILKIEDEDEPVILDIESIRIISPGKYEIDLVSLINRKPIIFKLEEGKYIIDIDRI